MIKKFQNFNLNEESIETPGIKELLERVAKLEEENSKLEDKISDLNDEVADLEYSLGEKDNKIYGLEDSYEKLEKENNRLEKENEAFVKAEEKWEKEKEDFEDTLTVLYLPYSIFMKNNTEEQKKLLANCFIETLEIMQDFPLEFGDLLKKESGRSSENLFKETLNKEWVSGYLGGGAGLLNRFGIKD